MSTQLLSVGQLYRLVQAQGRHSSESSFAAWLRASGLHPVGRVGHVGLYLRDEVLSLYFGTAATAPAPVAQPVAEPARQLPLPLGYAPPPPAAPTVEERLAQVEAVLAALVRGRA